MVQGLPNEWLFQCISCGWELNAEEGFEPPGFVCEKCGDLLQLLMRGDRPSGMEIFPKGLSITVWKYARVLPTYPERVTLGEGGTPLVKSTSISSETGLRNLYLKVEGQNPTGSFKDRGMTVAVTRALNRRAKTLVCASTGNTSASLAAYAARAGISSAVIIPEGKVAKGKLIQAVAYGARIVRVKGSFDQALHMILQLVSKDPRFYLMNSVNPYRLEGQKTVALEIYEQLGMRVPDYIFLPVGNAGNISAVWKGFKELKEWGIIDKLPRMVAVQAEGAAPIADAFNKHPEKLEPYTNPETVASAIRIGNPVSWKKAIAALKESGGLALKVKDEEIMKAKSMLSQREGIFVEAASASPLAGLLKMVSSLKDDLIVCIATGNGLKDQELVEWDQGSIPVAEDLQSLKSLLD